MRDYEKRKEHQKFTEQRTTQQTAALLLLLLLLLHRNVSLCFSRQVRDMLLAQPFASVVDTAVHNLQLSTDGR
jgi:hypothetical protein